MNSKTTTKITKQRVIAQKPIKEIKQNHKNSIKVEKYSQWNIEKLTKSQRQGKKKKIDMYG